MVGLALQAIGFSYGANRILNSVSTAPLPGGALTAVVGPNAAGKTTLLKCIAGLLKFEGGLHFDGNTLNASHKSRLAKLVSYLPQDIPVHAALTVFEAVLLARQQSFTWRVSDADLDIVQQTLRALGIEQMAMRYINELSGGQRQIVSIGQALARDNAVLLLDEPTSNLDLQHQLEVLGLVKRFSQERGITTIVTLHDLNIASRFADHFLVMNQGSIYSSGTASEVLTSEMLRDVYGVVGEVKHGDDGVPHVVAYSSIRHQFTEPTAMLENALA